MDRHDLLTILEAGLEAALQTGSPYVAFVASERKARKLKQGLKERGLEAGRVDAVLAPAGIEIGAVTPEEIARVKGSFTGQFLAQMLKKKPGRKAA